MGNPLTTKTTGICFAFPNVCQTPAPPPPGSQVPIPYPSIGQLEDADPVSDDVYADGHKVIRGDSKIKKTSGDEAGTGGPGPGGEVTFETPSKTVLINGQGAVRMFDTTKQNGGNAVGTVLAGVATVLVGG